MRRGVRRVGCAHGGGGGGCRGRGGGGRRLELHAALERAAAHGHTAAHGWRLREAGVLDTALLLLRAGTARTSSGRLLGAAKRRTHAMYHSGSHYNVYFAAVRYGLADGSSRSGVKSRGGYPTATSVRSKRTRRSDPRLVHRCEETGSRVVFIVHRTAVHLSPGKVATLPLPPPPSRSRAPLRREGLCGQRSTPSPPSRALRR